jgi:predicted dehydrogenase
MRAAAAGKHLFVEKPMAETSDQARAMAEAAEKANVVLQIGFNKRFYYAYREAARLIREGHIRRPTGIDARFVFPPSARRRLSPLHQVLLQNGIHFLDLVQALMGPAREINARALESEDRVTVAATLLFEGGEVGALLLSSCGSWSYPSERVDVLGSNGSTLSAENGRKLTLFRESQPALYLERTLSAHWLTGHDEAGFTPQLKAFARSVLDGDSVAASARDGVTALLVAESIETSIAVGQTVTIPPFDGPARVGPAGAA